jgi:ribosomal protein S18 acetylase RimI-like enzyme
MHELGLADMPRRERVRFRQMCSHLFPVTYTEDFYHRLFFGCGYFSFFIKHRGTYVGVYSVCVTTDEAYLLVFGISPGFRGRLIGTASLQLLEEFVSQRTGARILSLHVHSANLRATNFYLSNVYAPQGTVENYYNEIMPHSAHAFYKVLR